MRTAPPRIAGPIQGKVMIWGLDARVVCPVRKIGSHTTRNRNLLFAAICIRVRSWRVHPSIQEEKRIAQHNLRFPLWIHRNGTEQLLIECISRIGVRGVAGCGFEIERANTQTCSQKREAKQADEQDETQPRPGPGGARKRWL